jgi:hypothetical protein
MIQLLKINVLPADLEKYFTFMHVLGDVADLHILATGLINSGVQPIELSLCSDFLLAIGKNP